MSSAPSAISEKEEILSLLQSVAERNCKQRLVGVAIGVVFKGQEYHAVNGWADAKLQNPITPDTIFEIGSITKLFTSLLLAIAETKEELKLDDPVQKALGSEVKLPTDGEHDITFRSLANHRSSLPRLPSDLIYTADMNNPYAHYDQAMFYACLSKMKSLAPIGSQEEYSNFGVGLLGHALGRIAGTDYRTLLRERVLNPLNMLDSSAQYEEQKAPRYAMSHVSMNRPCKHWDFTEVTVGAGGIRASLSEMMKFLRANVEPKSTTLCDAFLSMRKPSEMPKSAKRSGPPVNIWLASFLVSSTALLISSLLCFPEWFKYFLDNSSNQTARKSSGFLAYLVILASTMVSAIYGRFLVGLSVLLLTCVLTWQFWHEDLAWVTLIIFGASLTYTCANMRSSQVSGDGRLAWQCSPLGENQMLWHNGMVGGSASFLGLIEDLGIGVIVLTNTAKQVDTIGIQILSELARRQSTR